MTLINYQKDQARQATALVNAYKRGDLSKEVLDKELAQYCRWYNRQMNKLYKSKMLSSKPNPLTVERMLT